MHLQRIFIPGIHPRLPGWLPESLHVCSYLHEPLSHDIASLRETWHLTLTLLLHSCEQFYGLHVQGCVLLFYLSSSQILTDEMIL